MGLAEEIGRSRLNGDYGTSYGIEPPWRDVERHVHDVAHAVTLGLRIVFPDYLRSQVHYHLLDLPKKQARTNEAQTIAVELEFLRRQPGAFLDDGGVWLAAVLADVRIARKHVRAAYQHPDFARWVRRLEGRLRYHAREARQARKAFSGRL